MKILILCNYANGLYLFRKEVLTAFLEKGYETAVSVPPDENCGKIENLGVRLIPTAFERRGNNPIHDGRLFLRYLRLLKKEKPDVVLTYTIKPNLYGGLACRLRRVPYLINVTGLGTAMEHSGMLGRILFLFYRIATRKAACVFFQNEANRKSMLDKKAVQGKNRLLPGSGVNLKEHPFVPYPSEDKGIVFLAVIRIMKDKGIEEYLEVAEKITSENTEARFYLVGEYEEETRAHYEPRIEALAAKGVIRYFGHIDNVPEVMAKSHIIVHPSYHEGLSNVLLEAAACGRLVVASDVPGCRETLCEGKTGFLFQPKDTESLLSAIRTSLSLTQQQRAQMGALGRQYVERTFDRQKVIGAYLEEIQKAVNNGL
ncbi:MAG: glycosyltransferase family 4 protein [Lachnospiraceae bacterium]|nr:glycosyltransferase family 4 protein [Lachnospiraceae bacterium]